MTTVADLKGQTVAFAASGGLDSCTVTKWLAENGVTVVCFTADIAQPDEPNFDEIETRMRACGAADYVASRCTTRSPKAASRSSSSRRGTRARTGTPPASGGTSSSRA